MTPPIALPRQAKYFITQLDLDRHWNSLLPHSLAFQLCSPCQLPFLQWSHALRDARSPIRLMNSVPAWLSSGRITLLIRSLLTERNKLVLFHQLSSIMFCTVNDTYVQSSYFCVCTQPHNTVIDILPNYL